MVPMATAAGALIFRFLLDSIPESSGFHYADCFSQVFCFPWLVCSYNLAKFYNNEQCWDFIEMLHPGLKPCPCTWILTLCFLIFLPYCTGKFQRVKIKWCYVIINYDIMLVEKNKKQKKNQSVFSALLACRSFLFSFMTNSIKSALSSIHTKSDSFITVA